MVDLVFLAFIIILFYALALSIKIIVGKNNLIEEEVSINRGQSHKSKIRGQSLDKKNSSKKHYENHEDNTCTQCGTNSACTNRAMTHKTGGA